MYRELVAMDALGELASTASTAAGFTARAIEEIGNILPSQAELASLIPRLFVGSAHKEPGYELKLNTPTTRVPALPRCYAMALLGGQDRRSSEYARRISV